VNGVASGPVTIQGNLTGMMPGLHGFHVHQYGNLAQCWLCSVVLLVVLLA